MNTVTETATRTRSTSTADVLADLRAELRDIEIDVLSAYTLADAIREGSTVTVQANGWGNGGEACALSAALLTAHVRGWVQ